uniref:EF-hand domain-containing protein n=1 Tax=Ciona savignyi TaxID=51511 RepID=H2ZBI9_CIOSA
MMKLSSLLVFTTTIFHCKAQELHTGGGKSDKEVLFGLEEGQDDIFNLPESEQKELLAKLVQNKIDQGKDGFVDYAELESWSLKSLNDFETEDSRQEFSSVDENEDGKITRKEYSSFLYGEDFDIESEQFQGLSPDWKNFLKTYNKDTAMFTAADRDNDGSLVLDEYINFKHPQFSPATREVLLADKLSSADLNKDGGIDLDEFLTDSKEHDTHKDPDWKIVETDKFTEDLDQNKDGVLKGEEIVQWVASDNTHEARDEADHLIEESDQDGDGKLSVDEILNNHALWVDSDATDYGRQLLKNHDEL